MRAVIGSVLVAVTAVAASVVPAGPGNTPALVPTGSQAQVLPLSGRTVVLDAGHQLGNRNFPREIAQPVPAGGFTKPCNTTGTATNGGYAEATFTWAVTRLVRDRLHALGARVVLTRTSNSDDLWGPCVDVRGRSGNRIEADLKLSIHADGSYGGGPGFHVIAPTSRVGWTRDIYRPSRRLALGVRTELRERGLRYAAYVAGGDGLAFRGDLGTLNLSDVPAVMVELGNMRSVADARRMTSRTGRSTYAAALVAAIRQYLT